MPARPCSVSQVWCVLGGSDAEEHTKLVWGRVRQGQAPQQLHRGHCGSQMHLLRHTRCCCCCCWGAMVLASLARCSPSTLAAHSMPRNTLP
jgi:hypothetical protein